MNMDFFEHPPNLLLSKVPSRGRVEEKSDGLQKHVCVNMIKVTLNSQQAHGSTRSGKQLKVPSRGRVEEKLDGLQTDSFLNMTRVTLNSQQAHGSTRSGKKTNNKIAMNKSYRGVYTERKTGLTMKDGLYVKPSRKWYPGRDEDLFYRQLAAYADQQLLLTNPVKYWKKKKRESVDGSTEWIIAYTKLQDLAKTGGAWKKGIVHRSKQERIVFEKQMLPVTHGNEVEDPYANYEWVKLECDHSVFVPWRIAYRHNYEFRLDCPKGCEPEYMFFPTPLPTLKKPGRVSSLAEDMYGDNYWEYLAMSQLSSPFSSSSSGESSRLCGDDCDDYDDYLAMSQPRLQDQVDFERKHFIVDTSSSSEDEFEEQMDTLEVDEGSYSNLLDPHVQEKLLSIYKEVFVNSPCIVAVPLIVVSKNEQSVRVTMKTMTGVRIPDEAYKLLRIEDARREVTSWLKKTHGFSVKDTLNFLETVAWRHGLREKKEFVPVKEKKLVSTTRKNRRRAKFYSDTYEWQYGDVPPELVLSSVKGQLNSDLMSTSFPLLGLANFAWEKIKGVPINVSKRLMRITLARYAGEAPMVVWIKNMLESISILCAKATFAYNCLFKSNMPKKAVLASWTITVFDMIRGVIGSDSISDMISSMLDQLWILMWPNAVKMPGDMDYYEDQGLFDGLAEVKIDDMVMLAVSIPFMPNIRDASSVRECFGKITAEYNRIGGVKQQSDLLARVFSFVKWLMETGTACFYERSFAPFFESVEPWYKWYDEAQTLIRSLVEVGVSIEADEYDERLQRVIKDGEMLRRSIPRQEGQTMNVLNSTIMKLQTISSDTKFRVKVAAARPPPFYVGVYGAPKTGKTVLIDELIRFYYLVRRMPYTVDMKMIRNAAAKHDDGMTSTKRAFVFDDVGMMKPEVAPEVVVNCLKSIMELANSQRMPANMADLADKGRIFPNAHCVFVTSNDPRFGAAGALNFASAYLRRIRFKVSLSVKPEFRDGENNALDTAKLLAYQEIFPDFRDFQLFTVSEFKLRTRKNAAATVSNGVMNDSENDATLDVEEVILLNRVDSDTFFDWYTKAIVSHVSEGETAVKLAKNLEEETLCFHERLFGRCKICCFVQGYVNRDKRYLDCVCDYDALNPKCSHISITELDLDFGPYKVEAVEDPLEGLLTFLIDGKVLRRSDAVDECLVRMSKHKNDVLFSQIKDRKVTLLYNTKYCHEYMSTGRSRSRTNSVDSEGYETQGGVITKSLKRCAVERGARMTVEVIFAKMHERLTRASLFAKSCYEKTGKLLLSHEVLGVLSQCVSVYIVGSLARMMCEPPAAPKLCVCEDQYLDREKLDPEAVYKPCVDCGYLVKVRSEAGIISCAKVEVQGVPLSVYKDDLMGRAGLTDVYKPVEVKGLILSTKSQCAKLAELILSMKKNFVSIRTNKGIVHGFGLDAEGSVLSVAHMFDAEGEEITLTRKDQVVRMVVDHIVKFDKVKDYIVFKTKFKFKDLKEFFPVSYYSLTCPDESMLVFPEKTMMNLHTNPKTYQGLDKYHYYSDTERNVKGDCGAMLVGRLGKSVAILGMHHLGTTKESHSAQGMSVPITQSMLDAGPSESIKRLGVELTRVLDRNGLGLVADKTVSYEPHHKSYAHFRPDMGPNVEFLCTIPYGMRHDKTKFVKTPLFGKVPPTTKEPPEFKLNEPGSGTPYRSWYNNFLDSLIERRANYPKDLMWKATHRVLKRYAKIIKKLPKAHPLDEEASLNGWDGVRFIDAFKKGTGQGLPKRGPKSEHIVEKDGVRMYTERARKSVQWLAEGLAKHENRGIVADVTLKDELKKPGKNVRGFGALPFGYNDIMRRLCLPLFKLIQENPLLFGISIGINAESYEWKWLYMKHLARKFHVLYDFKEYDRSHSAEILHAAHFIIFMLLMILYDDDATVCGIPWHKVAAGGFAWAQWPLYNVNDSIYRALGSLVSGLFHTAMINSIIQAIILEMLWLIHEAMYGPSNDAEDSFSKSNSSDKYGDDGKNSTDVETFNLPFMAENALKWNLIMTDPYKRNVLPTNFPEEEWTFLKRSFRFDENNRWVFAPLEFDSIMKAINYWEPPTQGSHVDELLMRTNNALEYLVVWQTPETDEAFDQVVQAFGDVYPKHKHRLWTKEQAFARKCVAMDEPPDVVDINLAHGTGMNPAAFEANWYGKTFHMPDKLTKQNTRSCSIDYATNKEAFSQSNLMIDVGGPSSFWDGTAEADNKKAITLVYELQGDDSNVPHESVVETDVGADEQSTDLTKFASSAPDAQVDLEGTARAMDHIAPAPTSGLLSDFFRRPVAIYDFDWVPASTAFHIDPWALWMSNAGVRKKLDNYTYFRGVLHLSVQYNGTPFHAGRIMVSYEPTNWNRNSVDGDWRQHSNCPHGFVDPSTNAVLKFACPFISPFSWMSLTGNARPFNAIGVLNFDVLANLTIFQGGTPSPVTLQVYAWMEQVELSYPTTTALATFISQGDEYEVVPNAGLISGPMAMVAGVASRLHDVPVIGRFATAASIGASAIGNIAKLFGYSRPRDLNPIVGMRQLIAGDMASTDLADSSAGFTLNSKSQISIDPRSVGVDTSVDELGLDSFVRRWTIVKTCLWNRAQQPGTVLESSLVHPTMWTVNTATSYAYSSLGFASALFEEWHGDIEIRIQIAASRLHRGRLRFCWRPDPASSPDLNLTYNEIVDVSDMREYCVTIPYVNLRPFTQVVQDGASVGVSDQIGTFSIIIQNHLVCPTDENINIIMSVRGGANFRLVNPVGTIPFSHHGENGFPPWQVQRAPSSLEFEEQGGDVTELGQAAETDCVDVVFIPSKILSHLEEIHYADPVRSFRSLIKRYSLISSVNYTASLNAGNAWTQRFYYGLYPAARGLSPAGNWEQLSSPYRQFSVNQTVLATLEPCFLGKKGGHRYIIDANSCGTGVEYNNWLVGRVTLQDPVYYVNAALNGAGILAQKTKLMLTNMELTGLQGVQLFPEDNSMGRVHVELPFYSPFKYTPWFDRADCTDASYTQQDQVPAFYRMGLQGVRQAYNSTTTNQTSMVDSLVYGAAAEDLTMFFFRGVPIMYKSAGIMDSKQNYQPPLSGYYPG